MGPSGGHQDTVHYLNYKNSNVFLRQSDGNLKCQGLLLFLVIVISEKMCKILLLHMPKNNYLKDLDAQKLEY